MPISSYMPSGRQNFCLNEYQTRFGKQSFQAKVTKSFPDGYNIETIIDGKPLRGVLFSNKPSSTSMGVNNLNRKTETMNVNVHVDHNSGVESEKSVKHLRMMPSQQMFRLFMISFLIILDLPIIMKEMFYT